MTETTAVPTYSVCFEEVLLSDLDFSFYDAEAAEEIADAAAWLAVDSAGDLNITPTCTEFPNYVNQGTLILKIMATSISNPSIVNEEVTVSLDFLAENMTECEPTWAVEDTTAWDTSLWRESSYTWDLPEIILPDEGTFLHFFNIFTQPVDPSCLEVNISLTKA